MRPATTLAPRTSKSTFARHDDMAGRKWSSLACACGFALIGLVLGLAVIFGPPRVELQLALELGAILFIAGTIGLGFALASSLVER